MAHTNRRVQTHSATASPIPDRLYYRIGEVASICGVAPSVLRFWETQFPQLRPTKGGTGQRLYRRRELDLALRIHQLVHVQGYTIAGARQAIAQPVSITPQPAQSSQPFESAQKTVANPAPDMGIPTPAISAPVASPQALSALRVALTELREMLTRSATNPANTTLCPASVPEAASQSRRRPRLAPLAPSLFAEFDS